MMLKREASGSKPATWWRRWGRAGSAAAAAAATAMTLAAGCLDRPVVKQDPATSNIYVDELRQTAVDKIDLLFMIDNSRSMADKQRILADAVPVLVQRLVNPICLRNDTNEPTGQNASESGSCPAGSQPEFSPIKDIHIAVVSSSLGAHGGDECLGTAEPTEDDKGWPIGKVRPNVQSWADTGFLAWDPDARANPPRPRNEPPGISDAMQLNTQFTNMVTLTGEVGCGYEASLEAWYRFLIDPEPSSSVTRDDSDPRSPVTVAHFNPLDTTLLDLRSKFLRPDSLVAIVMLTDENDCSIRDDGSSWLVGRTGDGFRAPRSATICDSNPNDKCCRSCLSGPTADCPRDPICDSAGPYLDPANDHINLRCYNQKARFGIDLLQPIERYVVGLTEPILRRDPRAREAHPTDKSEVIQNPLFAGGERDRSLVFLAGIVGVPWQDVATEESWPANAPLTYLTYDEMVRQGRWDWILPPDGQKFPKDALMFETPIDRTKLAGEGLAQAHPGTGAQLVPSCERTGDTWTCSQGSNPINGRETPISDLGDLQYACIFDLPDDAIVPNCSSAAQSCDCSSPEDQATNPLCQGASQIKAKAYPGVRELQVLKQFGAQTNNAIVASICPKISNANQKTNPSYGYTPAVSAIIERLKEALRGKCLPRPLSACNCDLEASDCSNPGDIPCQTGQLPGQVSCSVIEARQKPLGEVCPADCTIHPGRRNPPDGISTPVYNQLSGLPGAPCNSQQSCAESYCLCEIEQFTGDRLALCQAVTPPSDIYGYCYIDPEALEDGSTAQNNANQIVASCPSTQRRLLRFAGDNVPAKGAIALIACLGANVQN